MLEHTKKPRDLVPFVVLLTKPSMTFIPDESDVSDNDSAVGVTPGPTYYDAHGENISVGCEWVVGVETILPEGGSQYCHRFTTGPGIASPLYQTNQSTFSQEEMLAGPDTVGIESETESRVSRPTHSFVQGDDDLTPAQEARIDLEGMLECTQSALSPYISFSAPYNKDQGVCFSFLERETGIRIREVVYDLGDLLADGDGYFEALMSRESVKNACAYILQQKGGLDDVYFRLAVLEPRFQLEEKVLRDLFVGHLRHLIRAPFAAQAGYAHDENDSDPDSGSHSDR